jgi:hemoglobin/transferrin/lactoferrin receptor protein
MGMLSSGRFFFNSIATCVITSLAILQSSQLMADESDDKAKEEEPVIVVIGKMPRPVDDVVGSATVISRKQLDDTLVHSFSDLVRYQSGLSFEYSGTRFGESGLAIRGIGGNRVAMEMDGIPIADQFDIGSYSNSGRNFIDTELLQRVEILRGPASSLYGSDAIGGVVSFISKTPRDLLSQVNGDQYLGGKVSYDSVDASEAMSLQAALGFERSSALIALSERRGNEMDHSAQSAVGVDPQTRQQSSQLFYGVYELNANHELSFRYQTFSHEATTQVNSILGRGRFASTTSLTGDDQSESESYLIQYEFDTDWDWLTGGVARVYQQTSDTRQLTDEQRLSRGTPYHYDRDFYYQQKVDGIRLNLFTQWSGASTDHQVGYGIEWSDTRVTELRNALQTNLIDNTSTNVILSETFPLRDFPISDVEELGFYLNDQITLGNSGFTLVPGVRYDRYQLTPQPDTIYREDNPATSVVAIDDSRWSPKLGLMYQPREQHQVYLQVAKGFRAPPFEDANIGLDIPLFNIRAIPNPDLKSETSTGYELGYRYRHQRLQWEWVIFHNDYHDFIQTKVNLGLDPATGRILFQSQNLDRATIYGSEVNLQYQLSEAWSVSSQLFWSKGENRVDNSPLNDVSPHQWLLGFHWQQPQFSGSVYGRFVAAKDELTDPASGTLFRAPGYAVFDLLTHYQISPSLRLSAALYNFTDKRYWNWSMVNNTLQDDPILGLLSAPGRSFSLQLSGHW